MSKTPDLKARLNKRLEISGKFSLQIPQLLSKIDSLRAEWQYNIPRSKAEVVKLSLTNVITSAAASNRIEDIVLSDQQVADLFSRLSEHQFTNRTETEVAGYLEVLNNILDSFARIDLNVQTVLYLHAQVLKYAEFESSHRGRFKEKPNRIIAQDKEGNELGIIHIASAPDIVEKEIHDLVDWLTDSLKQERAHTLLVIANFVIEFLAIHPFKDGNGRVSRLLTVLLLLKTGYNFSKYASHEREIEKSKEAYYLALRTGQSTWKSENEDMSLWIYYFLNIVLLQGQNAMELAKSFQVKENLSRNQRDILKYIESHAGSSRSEFVEVLGINENTVKQVLKKLTELKLIESLGKGRSVTYRVS